MGREVGGGFRMGNTCTPVVDPCQCRAKPLQYCKVISLNKINNFMFQKIIYFHFKNERISYLIYKVSEGIKLLVRQTVLSSFCSY